MSFESPYFSQDQLYGTCTRVESPEIFFIFLCTREKKNFVCQKTSITLVDKAIHVILILVFNKYFLLP